MAPLAEDVVKYLVRSSGGSIALRKKGMELVLQLDQLALPANRFKGKAQEALQSAVTKALERSLNARTLRGRRLRTSLFGKLAAMESDVAPTPQQDETVLTTEQAATQLGMSRPYVAMLCDNGRLSEVARSEGGIVGSCSRA